MTTPPTETMKALVEACQAITAAFDDLFQQCWSNPVLNAWGKEINLTKLNIANELASQALAKLKAGAA